MKKNLFDQLYRAAEAVKDTLQKPHRERSIRRAFEKLGDRYEQERANADGELLDLRHALANAENDSAAEGIIRKIAEVRIRLAETESFCAIVETERQEMFEKEVPEAAK